jgi:plasmid maintenance system antidote protein VapI
MRLSTPKGADHPQAKFNPEQVDALRRRFLLTPAPSLRQMAREAGVCRKTITEIVRGNRYRD